MVAVEDAAAALSRLRQMSMTLDRSGKGGACTMGVLLVAVADACCGCLAPIEDDELAELEGAVSSEKLGPILLFP